MSKFKFGKGRSRGQALLYQSELVLCFKQGEMVVYKSRYTHPDDGLTLMDAIKTFAIMLRGNTGIDVFDDFVKEEIEEAVTKILYRHSIGGGHASKLQRVHGTDHGLPNDSGV